MKLAQVNNDLGRIRSFQGGSSIPANNCFTNNLLDDILAPVFETVAFTYFLPPIPDVCDIPQSTGVNNYITTLSFIDNDLCGEEGGVPPKDPKRSDITILESEINLNFTNWQNDPTDLSSKGIYLQLLEQKDGLINALVRNSLQVGDYTEAESILMAENTAASQKGLLALKVLQEDYPSAQNVLNTMAQNTIDEQNYVWIQAVNLQRLAASETFELSDSQYNRLKNIAESESATRSGARGLLALLKNERFPVGLPGASQFFMVQQPQSGLINNDKYQSYPNPSQAEVHLKFPVLAKEEGFFLQLISVNGKSVLKKQLDNTGSYSFNTQDFPEGVYFLVLMEKGNVVYQHKVVILK